MASLLDIVRRCDNYVKDDEVLVPFSIIPTGRIIGLLRPEIVKELLSENTKNQSEGIQENWTPCVRLGTNTIERICFAPHLSTKGARSRVINEVCERWRDGGVMFQDVMGPRKWRNELYSIYENYLGPYAVKNPKLSYPHSEGLDASAHAAGEANHVFDIERSAAALFGLVTYGVHMTVFEKDEDGTVRLWTPTRAKTKQTCGGGLQPFNGSKLTIVSTDGQGTSTIALGEGYPAGWEHSNRWSRSRWRRPAWKKMWFGNTFGPSEL